METIYKTIEILLVEGNPGDVRLTQEVIRGGVDAISFLRQNGEYAGAPRPDIVRSRDLHSNCHVTKPVGIDRFSRVIRSVGDFWLTIVKLPRGGEDGR